jgi:hypothetical protein
MAHFGWGSAHKERIITVAKEAWGLIRSRSSEQRQLLSCKQIVFLNPYLSVIRKHRGCTPTLPILELAPRYSSTIVHPVLESSRTYSSRI